MIAFYKFFDYLRRNNIKQKEIVGIIGGATFQKLRNNEVITTGTINKICNHLGCKPEEILEHIPDKE